MYVYKEFGIDLPHNAALQYNLGTKIFLQQALPGDLVFFGVPPHHVAISLGNDLIVEAPHTGPRGQGKQAFQQERFLRGLQVLEIASSGLRKNEFLVHQ